MARITEEQKVQINELFYKYGVKAQVAKELGISAASVSRYIIPDYVPLARRNFNLKPIETQTFLPDIEELAENFIKSVDGGETISNSLFLSIDEWNDLVSMQKGEIF